MVKVYPVDAINMSNESPIVSFRVPLDAIAKLKESGRLPENFSKSDLSNLIKNDWLATLGQEVPMVVDARNVAKQADVDAVHEKLELIINHLQSGKLVA